ncbi:MAG: nucleoside recognition domain-containing protein, partial [Fusobacteriaceae bacterium]
MEKINKEKESYLYSSCEFIDIFKLVAYSSIGIFIFFIPIKLDGQTKTMLYHIAYKLQLNAEPFLEICTIVYIFLGCIKELLINHKKKIGIKKIYTYLRLFSIFIIASIFYGKSNFILLNENIIFLIKEIILNLITVLPLAAIFMPFIMEYGLLDIIESYCHKFMKKAFKLSGKTVLNIMVYIFTDCFCGYFMTNKLYKDGKIRENEACMIILNFSILSFSMINYVCEEFSLKKYSFILATIGILFISNMILCRVYPLSKKSKNYYAKTTYKETTHKNNKLKKGIKKYIENKNDKNIFFYIINNLEEV